MEDGRAQRQWNHMAPEIVNLAARGTERRPGHDAGAYREHDQHGQRRECVNREPERERIEAEGLPSRAP